jgi:hypothetical protein
MAKGIYERLADRPGKLDVLDVSANHLPVCRRQPQNPLLPA